MAAKFKINTPTAGQFNWVLKSQGRTLATGESYTRKVSAEKAIESLRKAAAGATVSDLTVKPANAAPVKAATKAVSKPAKTGAKAARKSAGKATAAKEAAAKAHRTAGKARKRAAGTS